MHGWFEVEMEDAPMGKSGGMDGLRRRCSFPQWKQVQGVDGLWCSRQRLDVAW